MHNSRMTRPSDGGQPSGLHRVFTRLASPGYVLVAPFIIIAIVAFVLDVSFIERLVLAAVLVALVVAIRYLYQPWWLRRYGRRR